MCPSIKIGQFGQICPKSQGVNLVLVDPLSHNKKCRLVQTQSTCRLQLECGLRCGILFVRVETTVGKKGENTGYQHFFPFVAMTLHISFNIVKYTSLSILLNIVKYLKCVVKS